VTPRTCIPRRWAGHSDRLQLGWKLAQVCKGASPESLLDTYHAERHPVAAPVLRNTMASVVLRCEDERTKALRDTMSELRSRLGQRQRPTADVHCDGRRYELSEGMSYHVPDDEAAPHRLTSNEGASVFIVD